MKADRTLLRIAALLLLALFAATSAADSKIDDSALKHFLEPTDYRTVRLSPDGRHISLITRRDDRNTLVVMDLETMQPTASVRYEESRDIDVSGAEWIDSNLLYYTVARKVAWLETPMQYPEVFLLAADGSRNDRVWNVHGNYEDNSSRRGELSRGYPSIVSLMPGDPYRVLLFVRSFERRDGAGPGRLAELDLRNGDTKPLETAPGFTEAVLGSDDGSRLLALGIDREFNRLIHLSLDRGENWRPIGLDLPGYVTDFDVLEFKGDSIYALAQRSDGPDAPSHVLRYDVTEGDWKKVHDIGFSLLQDLAVDDDGRLTRVQWYDDRPRIQVFEPDDRVSRVLQSFARSYPGFRVSAVSETDDGARLLVHVGSGAYQGEYFLYDAESRQARFLVAMDEHLDGADLSELQPVRFQASDGVTVPGWFQPPRGVEKPPLVVDIHGGPHGPYHPFGFNPDWHLLNAMGYAVYAPNFRGSGGYGKGFERAGFGLWGTRMLDDVAEGARHLVEQGKVDGSRVCVYGGSYGGYGAAQSLVRHNDLYRCGVIIAGVFDLEALKKGSDIGEAYFGDNYMDQSIGDDPERLRAMSPIHNLERIRAPMLVLHGEEDERTPFRGAVDFVEAASKAGKDVEHRWYPNEGHGNAKLENRIDAWRRIEAFLARANAPQSPE
jgi:dipeptidyl aminopeptidase/acylaminoacyl peptidase